MIERVGGHARSLVLLAPLVAERGLKVTADAVAHMLAEFEARHPGKRELSLLASVRLSLDRLPEPARTQARALAVFHGTAHLAVLAHVLQTEPDETLALCRQLVELGLADAEGPYLFPDPALGPAVTAELSEKERVGMEERWLESMLSLIDFLYEMQFKDAKVAREGTQAALKDLLAALAIAEKKVEAGGLSADTAMGAVTKLQPLVTLLSRSAMLSRLVEMRRRLEQRLGEWNHARFELSRADIDQRLTTGDLSGAVQAAERLKERAEAGGDADASSAYDRAMACNVLGQALSAAGRASEALWHLEEAERRFTELARDGEPAAARMLSVVAARRGIALQNLGRLDEAAESYRSSIEIAKATGNDRNEAVGRMQLGTVRLLQGRLRDALNAYEETRQVFEALHEPETVAGVWYQIGMVYQMAKQRDRSEAAYQQALRLRVERGDRSGQAATLNQMGLVYGESGRSEEAAQLHQQATVFYEELGDSINQARSLSNLADVLKKLGRLDEAREAAAHTARLEAPFGHAAEPWKTWDILHDIETLAGRPDAASAARSRAIELYAAYRRDGGEPQSSTARLIAAVGEVLRENGAEEARRLIPPPEQFGERLLPIRDALLAILDGFRDPALAQDTRLLYAAAVELSLLLESL